MYSLEELTEIVEKSISTVEFPEDPQNLYKPIKYILSNGGKRIRPVFTLASCNLFAESIEKAIFSALAVEMFHNFTLVHDDIMDGASIRRGKETIHIKWNTNTAILSGDAMTIVAYQLLSKSNTKNLQQVLDVFNSFAIGICEGQQLDMDFENQKGVSLEEYTRMIELKTAILLKGALQIGAIVGEANPKDVELIGSFGLNLGLAFQLQDDLLDVYGDPSVFGKKEGGDIVANKKTVLTIMAFNKASGKNLEVLNNLYGTSDIEPSLKIKEVVRIFNEENIKEDVELLIASYFDKALDSLEKVSVTPTRKEILKSLANKIMIRNN